MLAAARRCASSVAGATPVTVWPYVNADVPPVRNNLLVDTPLRANFLNRGIRLLSALSLAHRTVALRLVPAPIAAPSEVTRALYWTPKPLKEACSSLPNSIEEAVQ